MVASAESPRLRVLKSVLSALSASSQNNALVGLVEDSHVFIVGAAPLSESVAECVQELTELLPVPLEVVGQSSPSAAAPSPPPPSMRVAAAVDGPNVSWSARGPSGALASVSEASLVVVDEASVEKALEATHILVRGVWSVRCSSLAEVPAECSSLKALLLDRDPGAVWVGSESLLEDAARSEVGPDSTLTASSSCRGLPVVFQPFEAASFSRRCSAPVVTLQAEQACASERLPVALELAVQAFASRGQALSDAAVVESAVAPAFARALDACARLCRSGDVLRAAEQSGGDELTVQSRLFSLSDCLAAAPLHLAHLVGAAEAMAARRRRAHAVLGLAADLPRLRPAQALAWPDARPAVEEEAWCGQPRRDCTHSELKAALASGFGAASSSAEARLQARLAPSPGGQLQAGGRRGSPPLSRHLLNAHELCDLPKQAAQTWMVRGAHAYYHYGQDGSEDSGWGCAYRSLQTLWSWFLLQGYTSLPPPAHRAAQAQLVALGDKPADFAGSRRWIGAIELGYVLDAGLGVTCKILTARSGADVPGLLGDLAQHFATQGTPVMVGGGVLAYTLLGVGKTEAGEALFCILDPHYVGPDEPAKIRNKWVSWKMAGDRAAAGGDLFVANAHYNLLCPQRPKGV